MIAVFIGVLIAIWIGTLAFSMRFLLTEWRYETLYTSPYGRHPIRPLTWGHILAAFLLAALFGSVIWLAVMGSRTVKFVQSQTNTAEKVASVLGVQEKVERPSRRHF